MMKNREQEVGSREQQDRLAEQGFMLVGLIVAIVLMLLVLAMAAPKVAQDLRRERELEAAHRGNQYVRAIQLYYKKFGHYPGSMEQLEKTNNIRFLRKRYVDPVSGKDDWRVIPVGQNKTTVKGFFGQPLAGIASTGLGSAAGMASSGLGAAAPTGSAVTAPGGAGAAGGGGAGAGGANTSTGLGGSAGGSTFGLGSSAGLGSAAGNGASTASSFGAGGGAVFMGVGLSHTGDSVITLNEQTTYDTWEFIYDPRIEALKSKTSLLGGAPTAAPGTNGIGGQTPGAGIGGAPGIGGTPGMNGATGTGTTGGAGTTGGTTAPPQP